MAEDIVILLSWLCKVQNLLKIIVVYHYGADIEYAAFMGTVHVPGAGCELNESEWNKTY